MEQHNEAPNPLSRGQTIRTGVDGRLYCVFPSGAELDIYNDRDPHKRYAGKRVCCAGGYDNAICLED